MSEEEDKRKWRKAMTIIEFEGEFSPNQLAEAMKTLFKNIVALKLSQNGRLLGGWNLEGERKLGGGSKKFSNEDILVVDVCLETETSV